MQGKIFAVGLTGGIGSGKTEVGKIFETIGAKLIKADLIARELIDSNKSIRSQIEKTFGKDIYLSSSKLDRQKVGKLIFANRNLQEQLNRIVHPHVINQIDAEIKLLKKSKKYPLIVVEAALIYEAGTEDAYDYIIVVDASEESRIKRLIARDNASRDEIMNRFKAQLPQEMKIEKADFVIQNDCDLKSLQEKCSFIFGLLKQLSMLQNEPEVS